MLVAVLSAGCPDDGTTVTGGAGGGAGGSGTGGGSSEPAWQAVFDQGALDRALLSIWGTSSKSVYAVGGPLKSSGFDALALHFDGSKWKDLAPGGTDSFWWVYGTSDDDVWMTGENGRITHYDGATFEEYDSGTTATLWGLVAFAPDDAWAVGGIPGTGGPDDVVLRWDGVSWTPVTLPGAPLGRTHFKVWGTSSDDLFVVGEAGLIWHKVGADWFIESDPPIASGNLLTVHGCSATEVYAVGGRDLLQYDGSVWTKVDKSFGNDVNGVFCAEPAGAALSLVGMGGLKQREVDGTWNDDFTKPPHGDLHATWIDDTGAVWAAGGDFISSPKAGQPRNGIVARYGPGKVSSTLE
jgi:hypothetical protein